MAADEAAGSRQIPSFDMPDACVRSRCGRPEAETKMANDEVLFVGLLLLCCFFFYSSPLFCVASRLLVSLSISVSVVVSWLVFCAMAWCPLRWSGKGLRKVLTSQFQCLSINL